MTDALEIRNFYYPEARIAVLSNATQAGNKTIFDSLIRADMNILKLDSAIEETMRQINCPREDFRLDQLITSLKNFKGKLIIQTLFFRGTYKGMLVDNTTEVEVTAWLNAIAELRPECVMIYSIARDTAVTGLNRVGIEELTAIAERIQDLGLPVQVAP
jgi:wyosine [tRNA(Phe)-imidazoG37] synthetase (radical SAM superfamily)